MNATVDPEIRKIRMQAYGERKVESCERPDDNVEKYSILKSLNIDEQEDQIAILMKST
jgi:hypothetical protein